MGTLNNGEAKALYQLAAATNRNAKAQERIAAALEGMAERDRYRESYAELLSAAKQWRQATESRVKLIAAGTRQPESSDIMLHPDKAFIAVLDRLQSGERDG
jgi:hypothetical protein